MAPGKAKVDSLILSTLINVLSQESGILDSRFIEVENYNFVKSNFFIKNHFNSFCYSKLVNKFIFSSHVNNFYLSDPISKASPTMSKCSKQLLLKNPFAI